MPTRPTDLSDPLTQASLSPAGIRIFANIMEMWGVEEEDAVRLFGNVPLNTYRAFKNDSDHALLGEEILTRISLFVGIFKALRIVYSRKLADEWVHLPNTNKMFNGSTPLSYMIQGGIPAIENVWRLLTARSVGN